MSDTIVFTYWESVIYGKEEIPVQELLNKIDESLNVYSNVRYFGVYYNEKEKKYFIKIDGQKYEAVFQDEVKEIINNGGNNTLTLRLNLLANKTKQMEDETAIKETRKEIIERIDKSNYEEIETPENYQIYLEYLEDKLSTAKTNEEKRLIDTKMANIIRILGDIRKSNTPIVTNPLELKYDIVSYLKDILDKCNLLERKDQIFVAKEVKKIILEYKKLQNDIAKGKNKENNILPVEILDKINELEQKIMLLSDSNDKEKVR